MEVCVRLTEQIFSLMLIGAAGFLLAKAEFVTGSSCRPISSICLYIFAPCMILGGFLIEWTHEKRVGMVIAFFLSCCILGAFVLVAELLRKLMGLSEIDCASLTYTNAGNLLMPLIAGALGEDYIFYCCGFMVAMNLLIWGWSANRISGQKGFQFKRFLKNPTIIAITLGFCFMLFPLQLPASVVSTIKSVGNSMATTSMVVVGILLAGIRPTGGSETRGAKKIIALRLGLFPLITLAVLFPLSRILNHPDIWQICFVLTLAGSGPCSSQVTQLAQLYGVEAERASYVNSLTTLLCSVTLPIASVLALWLLA